MTEQEYRILQPILNSEALERKYGRELPQADKMAIRFFYLIRLYQNNCRRAHRLPMIRRVGLRKARRLG